MKTARRQKKVTKRTPRKLLMPGELCCGPTIIIAPLPMVEGGILRGHIKYILTTRRHDEDWQIELEWIDKDMGSHIVRLPDAVTQAIYRHRDQIIAKSLKARGMKAHMTATMNAREREQAEKQPEGDDQK